MNGASDSDLLAEFVRNRSETAFAQLVERHVNLVYSVALRCTASSEQAQDISQAVFVTLAAKAGSLERNTVLPGWLYHTSRLIAANWRRSEFRRARREQEACMDPTVPSSPSDSVWRELAPELDAAMATLAAADRDALVLRYFKNQSMAEVGAVLGCAENTAQQRIGRALEKLRNLFARRGITLTATAVAAALSTNAIQSAPAGLAATITASILAGTAATTATVATLNKIMAMTTLQKIFVTAALVVTTGASILEARKISELRAANQALQQSPQPASPSGSADVSQLQRQLDDATNRLAAMAAREAAMKSNELELMRLRGMAGVARHATEEVERLRRELAQQTATGTNFLTGAMADSMKQAMDQQVIGQLARLTADLNLTPAQVLAASNILMNQSALMSAGMQQALSGKFDKDAINKLAAKSGDPDTQIKKLLTPDQLAAYPQYQRDQAGYTASLAANSELTGLEVTLTLTPDQLDPAYAALYNVGFDQLMGKVKPSGDVADVMEWTLDQKAAALEPILTPAQMDIYRKQLAQQVKISRDVLAKMRAAGIGQKP